MSEAHDPRAGDTISITPDSSQAETVRVDSAGVESGSSAPTLDLNPGERGPNVAETNVAPSPSVMETVDTPSPRIAETLDAASASTRS